MFSSLRMQAGIPAAAPRAAAAPSWPRPARAAAQGRRARAAPDGAAEPAAAPQGRAELQRELKRAIAVEDYALAARLKQALDEALLQDPLVALQRQLQAAVEEERYQDAARLRDQLRELQEKLQPPKPDATNVPPTNSDTATSGVRVRVQSAYVPSQSVPSNRQFFFAYRVTISNEGQAVVMLKSRHWVITDGDGHVDHVRGPGVVGEQPVLKPGDSFQYESACPLRTPTGKMEGSYQMVVMDSATGEWADTLEVAIGAFGLNKDAPRPPSP